MPQYWVVGATWGDEDKFDEFVEGGYWQLGYDDGDQRRGVTHQIERRKQIRKGDHIAIKIRGGDTDAIIIRAVGRVTGVDPEGHRVYVRWVASNLRRKVPSRGHFESIRSFPADEEWTRRVFLIKQRGSRREGDELPDVDAKPLAIEGGRRWRMHLATERKRVNVKRKKAQFKRDHGSIKCQICDFDFFEAYGDIGEDFCEVHHNVPLSQLTDRRRLSLDDLTVVCSNCHRMIHRTKPMMDVESFKRLYRKRIARTRCATGNPGFRPPSKTR